MHTSNVAEDRINAGKNLQEKEPDAIVIHIGKKNNFAVLIIKKHASFVLEKYTVEETVHYRHIVLIIRVIQKHVRRAALLLNRKIIFVINIGVLNKLLRIN